MNPLVLYTSPEDAEHKVTIEVDPMLSRFLRDHQRQGVSFVFDCLMGLKDYNGRGCILADDMGKHYRGNYVQRDAQVLGKPCKV